MREVFLVWFAGLRLHVNSVVLSFSLFYVVFCFKMCARLLVQCRGVFVVVYCALCLDCIVAFVVCGGC